ncbi:hypothetical protein F0562_004211 [Nyssa sinensis]|uniref:Uncharacterized protein n=1 Tax=Nyssa sinensis TaxID=561372 RepID=A0A5J5C2N9_9ASTE|nr:hypothetical protein F0562_004211 [Nyssa sinensis]
MATLQKFKFLATHCAVAGSPTRSPTTSPVVHLRRRKTLRMLLSRTGSSRRLPRCEDSPDLLGTAGNSPEKSKKLAASHKLKDLFISSPPLEDKASAKVKDIGEPFLPATAGAGGGSGGTAGRLSRYRSLRPLSATFRQRLLRRSWRPFSLFVSALDTFHSIILRK